MKRNIRFASLFLALILMLSLCACGASSHAKTSSAPAAAPAEAAYDYEMYAAETEENGVAGFSPAAGAAYSGGSDIGAENDVPENMTEKIIYSADANLETTRFDEALEGIRALVSELGGYMESTGIYGNNYYQTARGYTGGRSASFTIRIPCENFETLTSSLSDLGNVPYCNTYSENITRQYYDTQARLTAYKTQEARLLEMLAVAESVEDLLAIQKQLTEVQYEIDSLNSTLKNYDHSVSYSTMNLSVQEVEEYSPSSTVSLSFAQKLARGFKDSIRGIGNFFTEFALWLGRALPVLVLLAVAVLVVWLLVRRAVRKRPERRARRAEKRAKKREKLPPDAGNEGTKE